MPLGHVFWMDMLLFGTAINIVTTLAALLLFAADAPAAVGAAVHFSPLPYNIFLLVAVWQSAGKAREPWQSAARAAGLLWLLAATVI